MPRRVTLSVFALLALILAPPVGADSGDLAAHVLNRTAYGPDAWSQTQVAQHPLFGHMFYLAKQINPGTIDDSAFEAQLSAYPSLGMTYEELRANYCNSCPLGNASQPRKELAAAKIMCAR